MALSGGSKGFLVVLLILVGGFFGGLYAFNNAGATGEDDGQPVTVQIPEGADAGEVGDILAARDIVNNATVFRVLARFDERASAIQPGEYKLRTGMGVDQVLAVLSQPRPSAPVFTVTIPEGLTVEQTLQRIANAEDSPFTVAQLKEALPRVALPAYVPVDDIPDGAQLYEGLLFPATYDFFVDESPQDVLSRLVAETTEVLSEVRVPDGMTRYDVLTIASLIEREARLRREQPLVSSVIHNRLDVPMRLQIDATVQYARGEQTEQLLFEDLEIDSAWNTYEVDGLPPTPISGAGRAAIRAAARPEDTDFRFYVVCNPETGQHAFAESNDEHLNNVAQFRQVREEGGSFCEE